MISPAVRAAAEQHIALGVGGAEILESLLTAIDTGTYPDAWTIHPATAWARKDIPGHDLATALLKEVNERETVRRLNAAFDVRRDGGPQPVRLEGV